jgi:hypothetical protein
MNRYRRMNFAENKPRSAIGPGLVLILMLAALCVIWAGTV